MNGKQTGFTLIGAIFILLVLALLGSYMLRLSGTQATTAVYVLQGARAYQAARAGMQWAAAVIANGGGCAQISAASPLTFAGIDGFSVSLQCSSQSFSEAGSNPEVFSLTALGEYGSYGSGHYVSRRLQMTLVN